MISLFKPIYWNTIAHDANSGPPQSISWLMMTRWSKAGRPQTKCWPCSPIINITSLAWKAAKILHRNWYIRHNFKTRGYEANYTKFSLDLGGDWRRILLGCQNNAKKRAEHIECHWGGGVGVGVGVGVGGGGGGGGGWGGVGGVGWGGWGGWGGGGGGGLYRLNKTLSRKNVTYMEIIWIQDKIPLHFTKRRNHILSLTGLAPETPSVWPWLPSMLCWKQIDNWEYGPNNISRKIAKDYSMEIPQSLTVLINQSLTWTDARELGISKYITKF